LVTSSRKLFGASTDDTRTAYAETKSFYDNAHGAHLCDTARGDELGSLLISFVTATAPV
jgi:hypothetical protein